ncbi:MAG TPA: ABC transporter substrate binding protein [Burkholderiaceae bacterium]|nr:ABC transporter substrate binding protein [Burkholderiaceae bacterium]
MLVSYHAGLAWSDGQASGVQDILQRGQPPVELRVDYLDTKHVKPTPEYYAQVERLLLTKYGKAAPQLLLAIDDDALDFALAVRSRHYPNVPILFSGVSADRRVDLARHANLTGVFDDVNIAQSLPKMLVILGDTRRLVVIHDQSRTSLAQVEPLRKLAGQYPGLAIEYVTNETVQAIQTRLGRLGRDDLVLSLAFNRDANDRVLTHEEEIDLWAAAAKAPLLATRDVHMRPGVLGGWVVTGRQQGEALGHLALQVLRGTAPAAMPMQDGVSTPMFQHDQLVRWGIAGTALPPDAVVIGRPVRMIDAMRPYLPWLATLFGGMAMVIALLAYAIVQRQRTAVALKRSRQNYLELFNSSNEAIVISDPFAKVILEVNRRFTSLFGYQASEAGQLTSAAISLNEAPHTQAALDQFRQKALTGEPQLFEWRCRKKDGSPFWAEISLSRVDLLEGIRIAASVRDVSDRKLAEIQARESEEVFRRLFETSKDLIFLFKKARVIDCNQASWSVLGYAGRQDMLNRRLLDLSPAYQPDGVASADKAATIGSAALRNGSERFEWACIRADGAILPVEVTMTVITVGSEQIFHSACRDISEIAQYRKKVHYQAYFDALTDLPNRTLLLDRIRQTIADAAYHGNRFGLMLLDVDRFKEINDTFGHDVGDHLLQEVAQRLLVCVRTYDTVARPGGDEFAVLLPEVRHGSDLGTVADKMLQALVLPFSVAGREIYVSASIGIALYPDDSTEMEGLFKYADSAMYHAKSQGRNNFQFYAKELTARSSERLTMESALRRALPNGELELYYQPQINLATSRVIGAEALLRWRREGHGMVMPDKFIPIAEESGIIVEIGEWVLATACATVVVWNQQRAEPLKMAVNLSTRQFLRNDLVGSVQRILKDTRCEPRWLELEITESLLLDDTGDVGATLAGLSTLGLSISIDDFGTGYSALSYLNRFPVNQIKIDKSFIRDIPANRDKSELVKAILSIGLALHMEVVAEGVETRVHADFLRAEGCLLAQGYLYGKPMPREVFESFLVQTAEHCPTN